MLNYKTYYNPLNKRWLVFVHGFGGSLVIWKHQIAHFKNEYNLLLINLPWHGQSKINSKITTNLLNQEIKKILDKERIDKADFIGISLGTLVISQFTVEYPKYVHSLICAGSIIEVSTMCNFFIFAGNIFKYILPYKMIYNLAIKVIAPKNKAAISGKFYKKNFNQMKRKKIIEWIEYFKLILNGKKVINKLKYMNKNIIFISGEYDRMFIRGAKKSSRKLKKEMIVMKDCTHICNIDNPKLFNHYIFNFIIS